METRRAWIVGAIFCFVFVIVIAWFCWFNETTTVLVVRHAERADASPNTNLSPAGLARAQALVSVVEDVGLVAVYSTEYCRTAQTAEPSATSAGLTINVVQSGDPAAGLSGCTPQVTVGTTAQPSALINSQQLADHVLSQHRGEAVLIVGHSNTVPEIVAALVPSTVAPVTVDEAFDRLFVVVIPRYFASPRLAKARYGS